MSASTGLAEAGSSRGEIVSLLRSRGRVCVDELASGLGVSKQCIRKHLDFLEREGYVDHYSERGDRGRPAYVYCLTDKAQELFPRRYDLFARALLDQIGAAWGKYGLETVFCGCADATITRLKPHLAGLDFDRRVLRLTELLRELGYEAEAESQMDGSYLLTEWNCPQAELAKEYRQMCDRELLVYQSLLETEVVRESRIAAGDARCLYRVFRPVSS